ncbi:MAG: NAD(+)/NADH kinase [Polyangia bacterium]|jgi:NAD kinase/nicotinic acid mononucleotide adenylyltransferase|nr:NAD(+)/NADH kinase [Polyangia bacterium]
MSHRLAIFGGSFNPPGLHHRAIVERIASEVDEVVVVPCGPRPDKPSTEAVPGVHRAALADLAFGSLPGVRVDLFDLEASTFTRTFALEERYGSEGDVWHVVGADLIAGGARGQSEIQRQWARGRELWSHLRFLVVPRPGCGISPGDLPPRGRLVDMTVEGRSSSIREALFRGEDDLPELSPEVRAYVLRHGLYRGLPPRRTTSLALPTLRPLVVADPLNPRARELAELIGLRCKEDQSCDGQRAAGPPNLVLVLGGDGTMLRAIRTHWRLRLPFFGVNTGHLGFLLNRDLPEIPGPPLTVEHLPLLWVQTESLSGVTMESLAFNDAWVERASGHAAWLRVTVDGQERISPLVADGALVATAQGSPSYARAMGAQPLPMNTPSLLLVGSNVLRPAFWRPVVLPLYSSLELCTIDPDKRPLRGFVDGVDQGLVKRLTARVSRIAAVELAFSAAHHPAEKLARIQFPLEPAQEGSA